jgi:hypothetical protein
MSNLHSGDLPNGLTNENLFCLAYLDLLSLDVVCKKAVGSLQKQFQLELHGCIMIAGDESRAHNITEEK